MRLTKHHGLGNDFLVASDPSLEPDPALARAACDRNRGVGADGLLYLSPAADDSGADVGMVLLNADGGRAEMSGNGIGCLVQAALLGGLASGPTVSVRTDAGLRTVSIGPSDTPRTDDVTVAMGEPVIGDEEPEWVGGDILRAARIDVGNPHLVLHAAGIDVVADRERVAELGQRINGKVPGGINVEVIAAADGSDEVLMDVYERGVGLTAACGTGAVATAVAASRWGLTGSHVVVRMTGGPAVVDLAGAEPRLTTPITYVALVDYPWP